MGPVGFLAGSLCIADGAGTLGGAFDAERSGVASFSIAAEADEDNVCEPWFDVGRSAQAAIKAGMAAIISAVDFSCIGK